MALPAKQVNWTYSLNNRVSYTSLNQTAREVMFLIKNRLKTAGYTVKGSSTGIDGAMDGVDRWITATNALTRGLTTVTPVSWIVLTDGNGADILFAYVGATDDAWSIGVSHAGDYVAAATATFKPTSANAQELSSFFSPVKSLVGTETSGDRIVHLWLRPLARGFRAMVMRAGTGKLAFGVDQHVPETYAPSVSVSTGHGFCIDLANLDGGNNNSSLDPAAASTSQAFRVVVRTNQSTRLASCSRIFEAVGGTVTGTGGEWATGTTFAPELQGTGFMLRKIGLWSNLAGARGRVGTHEDWWVGRTTGAADGDTYGNREFVVINADAGLVWPWNGTPSVAGSPVTVS